MSDEEIEPTANEVKRYLDDHPEGLGLRELQAHFNVPGERMQEVLDELESEGTEPFAVIDIPDDVLRPIADYNASYQWLETDGMWAATVPEFRGVVATGTTHVACRDDLVEGLRVWISFRLSRDLAVPDVPGIDFRAYASR